MCGVWLGDPTKETVCWRMEFRILEKLLSPSAQQTPELSSATLKF